MREVKNERNPMNILKHQLTAYSGSQNTLKESICIEQLSLSVIDVPKLLDTTPFQTDRHLDSHAR